MQGRLTLAVVIACAACSPVKTRSNGGDSDGGGADADPGAPAIQSVDVGVGVVAVGNQLAVTCVATDPEGGDLTYRWETSLGSIAGSDETVMLDAEFTDGEATITCTVEDPDGKTDAESATATIALPLDGMVAYYPFDGDIMDASGNNHHIPSGGIDGTFVDGHLASDPANTALHFDGSNVLTLPDEAAFDLTGFTIAFWVSTESTTNNPVVLAKGADFGNYAVQALQINSRASYVHALAGGGNTSAGFGTATLGTTFTHLAVTYSGSQLVLYRDGVQQSSPAAGAPVQNNTPVTLGGGVTGPANFVGAIDELRFYSRVLSGPEIGALAGSSIH